MSKRIEAWAWKQRVGNATTKQVLARLANAADEQGWSWFGQARIARECELSRQTVNKHIDSLRGQGYIQVTARHRPDGKRATNIVRVLAPWVDHAQEPPPVGARHVNQGDMGHVNQGDSRSRRTPEGEELLENQPALRADAVPMGDGRWKIPSNSKPGVTYTVDLVRETCDCQAGRSRSRCQHVPRAKREQERIETERRSSKRAGIWDALVDLYREPSAKRKAHRGGEVTELAELLAAEHIPSERWPDEVRQRYAALVEHWGMDKVTEDAFVRNWAVAGKLVRGDRAAPVVSDRWVGHGISGEEWLARRANGGQDVGDDGDESPHRAGEE